MGGEDMPAIFSRRSKAYTEEVDEFVFNVLRRGK